MEYNCCPGGAETGGGWPPIANCWLPVCDDCPYCCGAVFLWPGYCPAIIMPPGGWGWVGLGPIDSPAICEQATRANVKYCFNT